MLRGDPPTHIAHGWGLRSRIDMAARIGEFAVLLEATDRKRPSMGRAIFVRTLRRQQWCGEASISSASMGVTLTPVCTLRRAGDAARRTAYQAKKTRVHSKLWASSISELRVAMKEKQADLIKTIMCPPNDDVHERSEQVIARSRAVRNHCRYH